MVYVVYVGVCQVAYSPRQPPSKPAFTEGLFGGGMVAT